MKNRFFLTLFALLALAGAFLPALPIFAQPTGPLPTLLPSCNPELPPNSGGCGIPHFLQLLRNIINWLFIIVTPISVILIGYGGILIMIAGGNPGMVERGKSVIKAATIGVVIAFSAWIIMYTLYVLVLQIELPYRPRGFP